MYTVCENCFGTVKAWVTGMKSTCNSNLRYNNKYFVREIFDAECVEALERC